jgi:hypothetical protein
MDELRSHLDRAAGPNPPAVDTDELHRRAASRRRRRRGAVTASVAIVLFAGAAWAAAALPDRTPAQQLTAGTGQAGPSTLVPDSTTSTTMSSTTPSTPTTMPPASSSIPPPTTGLVPGTVTTTIPPSQSTTTVPVASILHLRGPFDGRGPVVSKPNGKCPQLTHDLSGTADLDSGPSYSLHEDYCGVSDGKIWSGSGTFTLARSDGDGLAGTMTSGPLTLPTNGEPYHFQVTSGTGRYAGAVGSCTVDNHIRKLDPSTNEQYGTITCDLTLGSVSFT